MNAQNNDIEIVSKTNESSLDDSPPRIWELVLKFWKHTGAMVVIGIYMLFTLPPELVEVQVAEALGRFVFSLFLWFIVNSIAYGCYVHKQPSTERNARYRRIVFWTMFVLLVCGYLGSISRNIN